MGTYYDQITEKQAALIKESKLFFVASAVIGRGTSDSKSGPVNVSPKGGCPLHMISPNRVAYLDYPGSGNETARHAKNGGDMTIMVMSCGEDDAAIVRLYGTAKVLPLDDSPLAAILCGGARSRVFKRFRQIIEMEVVKTQTSCGYGVPLMQFVEERSDKHCGRRFKDPKP